jgi:hypothetical protein
MPRKLSCEIWEKIVLGPVFDLVGWAVQERIDQVRERLAVVIRIAVK